MKHLVFIVLEDTRISEDVISELTKNGYNGTIIPSTSLKHSLTNEGNAPMFFNIEHLARNYDKSTTFFMLVEQDKVSDVKNIVERNTDSFQKCHGGYFSVPLNDFEGSF